MLSNTQSNGLKLQKKNQELGPRKTEKEISSRGHAFEEKTFHLPTYCAHCSELIWGVFKQGFKCSSCGTSVHGKCVDGLFSLCTVSKRNQNLGNIPHSFVTANYVIPKPCDHCGGLIVGKGQRCSQHTCKVNVHPFCVEKVPPLCGLATLSNQQVQTLQKMASKGPRELKSLQTRRSQASEHGSVPSSLWTRSASSKSIQKLSTTSNGSPKLSAFAKPTNQDSAVTTSQDNIVPTSMEKESGGSPATAGFDSDSAQNSPHPPPQASPKASLPSGCPTRPLSAPALTGEVGDSGSPVLPADALGLQTKSHSSASLDDGPTATSTEPTVPVSIGVNDFEFLAVLGNGTIGKVWQAHLKGSDRQFAVKVLRKSKVLHSNQYDDPFHDIKEKSLMMRTNSCPLVCNLHATFQTPDSLYFAMDYCPNGSLLDVVVDLAQLPEAYASFVAAEIVSAVAFLHRESIIFRDLKLDNVLMDAEGHIKLIDFGMAKLLDKHTEAATTFCGTLDYMAPEIINEVPYSFAVDWWSLGVMLFEMIVGNPLWGSDPPQLYDDIRQKPITVPSFVSKNAKDIILALLARDPVTRLGGSGQAYEALEIQNHPFFSHIDWSLLAERKIAPPYVPKQRPVNQSESPTMDSPSLDSQPMFPDFDYVSPNMALTT